MWKKRTTAIICLLIILTCTTGCAKTTEIDSIGDIVYNEIVGSRTLYLTSHADSTVTDITYDESLSIFSSDKAFLFDNSKDFKCEKWTIDSSNDIEYFLCGKSNGCQLWLSATNTCLKELLKKQQKQDNIVCTYKGIALYSQSEDETYAEIIFSISSYTFKVVAKGSSNARNVATQCVDYIISSYPNF